MLTTGFTVFLGVMLILAKLPRRLMLRALKHDLLIDVLVSVLTLVIHWGTFSGVMAATVAGLLTSVATSDMKRLIGPLYRKQEGQLMARVYLPTFHTWWSLRYESGQPQVFNWFALPMAAFHFTGCSVNVYFEKAQQSDLVGR